MKTRNDPKIEERRKADFEKCLPIAAKWKARLGYFDPNSSGKCYSGVLSVEEVAEYDRDLDLICDIADQFEVSAKVNALG